MTYIVPSPFYQGTGVTTGVTFANPVVGEAQSEWPAVDPTTITLTFGTRGAETVWTYQGTGNITRTSTGVYKAEIPTDTYLGPFYVKWVGTGACAAVWVGSFPIVEPPI